MHKKVWLGVIALVLVAAAEPLIGRFVFGLDLDDLSKLGGALGPAVGLLALGAVVAALYSIFLQREANKKQDQALAKQDQALAKQEQAHKEETTERRHAALREAYAPIFAAADAWLEEVERYRMRVHNYASNADPQNRERWQRDANDAHKSLKHHLAAIRLLDPKRSWRTHQATREIRLEPMMDSVDNQAAFRDVIHYQIIDRFAKLNALQDELLSEFGIERERSTKSDEFEKKMLADAKARADAVEAEIVAQFKAARRAAAGVPE